MELAQPPRRSRTALPFGATVTGGRLMAVEVSGAVERFSAGIPKLLFPVSARASPYHHTHDGQRFLINHRQPRPRCQSR
jgi:hypothetical protein